MLLELECKIVVNFAATSKLRHYHENDNFVGSFGFRGEVLCSIADISLVEIVTRVQGRPNGYRKVMKARKTYCIMFQFHSV